MQIELRPVTNENWEACCALELTAKQQGFLEPNVYSIAQAGFEPTLVMRAIYRADELVGFLMYNTEREELDGYWIYRLMVDHRQGQESAGKQCGYCLRKCNSFRKRRVSSSVTIRIITWRISCMDDSALSITGTGSAKRWRSGIRFKLKDLSLAKVFFAGLDIF